MTENPHIKRRIWYQAIRSFHQDHTWDSWTCWTHL